MERYGNSTPPDYNLSAVTAPGYLIYSGNDWVVDHVIDVPKLFERLGNNVETYFIEIKTFNHLDYLFGISAPSDVYSAILELFSSF